MTLTWEFSGRNSGVPGAGISVAPELSTLNRSILTRLPSLMEKPYGRSGQGAEPYRGR